ncbi:MAG: hypothetical protein EHM55_01505 [Acidobacteria bacterium]|nr:MAG: hypothetical protein EHM55_01505 [Acidobacteriota bacterium]
MALLVQRMLSPILARLGSRTILGVGGALFLLNMAIPDPLPLVDEFLILAGTILLSRWAQEASSRRSNDPAGTTGSAPKHVGRGSTSGT